jgi:CubicO group peptidase (beta-lactamase class C family)
VPQEKAARIAQRYRQPKPGTLVPSPERDRPLTEKPSLMLGGHGLVSSAPDYERFCRMMIGRGELDGVRVLKAETVDLMFDNQLAAIGQRYGLGGAVDGKGGYSWGGANGTQFWIDRRNEMFGVFMVQTQDYRAPTYGTFRSLVYASLGMLDPGRGKSFGDGQDKGSATDRLRQAFERLDADRSGALSEAEYSRFPLVRRVAFAAADRDGDGSISLDEATELLRAR